MQCPPDPRGQFAATNCFGHRVELGRKVFTEFRVGPRDFHRKGPYRNPGQGQADDRVVVDSVDLCVGRLQGARDFVRNGGPIGLSANDGGLSVRHVSILSGVLAGPSLHRDQDFAYNSFQKVIGRAVRLPLSSNSDGNTDGEDRKGPHGQGEDNIDQQGADRKDDLAHEKDHQRDHRAVDDLLLRAHSTVTAVPEAETISMLLITS